MKEFKFKKIDAFVKGISSGNPAGVIYLNTPSDITVFEMQRIAKELKGFVNEVGYICQTDITTFDLKYHSSEREVDFCGHATIAIMYDLIKNRADLLEKDEIFINTNKGMLSVYNRVKSEDAVFISAPQPVFAQKTIDVLEIAKALRTDVGNINPELPISIVNAGLETLIVPIKGLDNTLSISPDLDELKGFCVRNKIDIITVFTNEVYEKSSSFRTRVFAPTFGYLEDPATGSGNSAFGYYLYENKLWQDSNLIIEQNKYLDNANIVKLEINKDTYDEVQVSFGGSAVVQIDGNYNLHS